MKNVKLVNTHTLTKAVLMASTNLSSGSSRSDWAWEGVVDHIRELKLSDSYTERRGGEGGERGRREGREERGGGEKKERKGMDERVRGGGKKREISFTNPLFSLYSQFCKHNVSIHSNWDQTSQCWWK